MKEEKETPSDSGKTSGDNEILINKDMKFKEVLGKDIQILSGKVEPNQFPMDGMPQVLADLINNSVEVYGSPLEYFACTLLVACGSVVRKRAQLDDGKYINYPQLWIMYIGSSGIGKDAPLKIAFKPIIEIDLTENYGRLDEEADAQAEGT